MSANNSNILPWKSGIWYNENLTCYVYCVDGNKAELKNMICLDDPEIEPVYSVTFSQGDFGPAHESIIEKTGIQNYNIQLDDVKSGKKSGVVTEDGSKIYSLSTSKEIDIICLMTPEKLEKLKENREPFDAPIISYYDPKPGSPGKLIWLSGPHGAGKSTVASLLAKDHGFVYFEVDSLMMFSSPFVDPNLDEPSLQSLKQKPLKGVPKDANSAVTKYFEVQTIKHHQPDVEISDEEMQEKQRPYFEFLAKTILDQRKRLGGDMAITHTIHSRKSRETLRTLLGSELIFIVLKLSMDCQRKRILDRHGEVSKELLDIYVKAAQIHEPAGADEENTFSLEITENDSRQDVLQRVLDIAKQC